MSNNSSCDNWRPLGLSTILSVSLHVAAVAALCAFPITSSPQLKLELGDVGVNIRLVALGEASLGTGYSEAGDGLGDGQPAPVNSGRADDEESDRHTQSEPADDAETSSDTLDEITSPMPNVSPASAAPPDVVLADSAPQAVLAVNHADRSESNPPRAIAPIPREPAGSDQPAGAQSTGRSVGVRSGVRLSGQSPPPYPAEAQRRLLEGEVILWINVSADGTVTETRVHRSCGHDLLDEAALRWARSLHFVAARRDDKPVSAEIFLPVRYKLIGAR